MHGLLKVLIIGASGELLKRLCEVLKIVVNFELHVVRRGIRLELLQVRHILFGVFLGLRRHEGDKIEVIGGQCNVEESVWIYEPRYVFECLF